MGVTLPLTALVPMRHSSERVVGKNYRPFAGRPLYHHIIQTLLACPGITEVAIDTDSPFILEDAAKNFPTVRLLQRPERLRDGRIPMNDILLHDVEQLGGEFFLQTHSTNPLLKSATVQAAIERFFASYPARDSLFGVTAVRTRFWDAQGAPVNHDPQVLLRTQDLPPLFEENSNLYIFPATVLKNRRNRIGAQPQLFEIPSEEAWDIDVELDFKVAEYLFELRQS